MRVTDLRGVDLDAYATDFDLTFSVLVIHPDGTVLHRYGGRDHTSADARLSMTSLVRFLKGAKGTAAAHRPVAREARQRRTLDDLPVWRKRVAERKKPLDCYHCHFVFDAEREQRKAEGTWDRDAIWRWPEPERVGLSLDTEDLGRVAAIQPDTPAARAGLQKDDRLLEVSGQPILTALDLSAVFERSPREAVRLPLRFARGGQERKGELVLAAGWKRGTPLSFSWRPSKWGLSPRPGFGGRPLSAKERAELGLAADGLAFRIGYIVDWGGAPDRRYGQVAREAGLVKGDVVAGIEGADLRDPDHLHAWWRLTRKPGDVVVVRLIKQGQREVQKVELRVPPAPE
ncbi:MAG: PDZ domain-containing protein [Planctomycetota bacterium]